MPRWILLRISFPISGLIAWLALGPVRAAGPALAGGVLAGLAVGAAEAWALHVPISRWPFGTALLSLAVAIDSDQGFTVFGASGALLFTVIIAVTTTVVTRRHNADASA